MDYPRSSQTMAASSRATGVDADAESNLEMQRVINSMLSSMRLREGDNLASTSAQTSASTSASTSATASASTSATASASSVAGASHTPSSASSASTPPPLTCQRCFEQPPTTRCLDCEDFFCHECCHGINTTCHRNSHALSPLRRLSPIGESRMWNDRYTCQDHHVEADYYCFSCNVIACRRCCDGAHRPHRVFSMFSTNVDPIRAVQLISHGRNGTRAVRDLIDATVSIRGTIERETAETAARIQQAMRYFIQCVEQRERALTAALMEIRNRRIDELNNVSTTLRGVLAGISECNEQLVGALMTEQPTKTVNVDQVQRLLNNFADTFKGVTIDNEVIVFAEPNYRVAEGILTQGDVYTQPGPRGGGGIQSRAVTRPVPRSSLAMSMRNLPLNPAYMSMVGAECVAGSMAPVTALLPLALAPSGAPQVHDRTLRAAQPVVSFGAEGPLPGQVSRPWGLCVNAEGDIVVADRRNNRVQVFSSDGEFKFAFGKKGSSAGEFELPAGITTDANGRIIVVDKDNHRVQIFTSRGCFVTKFGSLGKDCGQFQYPWDVAVNSAGNMVVTDTRNYRVQMFTADGRYLTRFVFEAAGIPRSTKSYTTPRGVCFMSNGNVLVTDFENHCIIMLDPTLGYMLGRVGEEGEGRGKMNRPSGLVCDDEGRIVVADSKNHRLLLLNGLLMQVGELNVNSPGLGEKDRPCDVALDLRGRIVVMFETLPDTQRDASAYAKEYIKIY